MGNGTDVTDVQLIDEDLRLRPGDIIDFHNTGRRGILVESKYTSSNYIEEEPFDNFYIFNRRRNDQIKIWKIFWFKRTGHGTYDIGYYSEKALRESIKCGKIKLHKKPL